MKAENRGNEGFLQRESVEHQGYAEARSTDRSEGKERDGASDLLEAILDRGFLPGDLTQKVDPYLRPLYDALYDFMGVDSYQKLLERGVVEVAPLAYMRGRTLSDSFIILDEAQNTTSEQMKMFLTRRRWRIPASAKTILQIKNLDISFRTNAETAASNLLVAVFHA